MLGSAGSPFSHISTPPGTMRNSGLDCGRLTRSSRLRNSGSRLASFARDMTPLMVDLAASHGDDARALRQVNLPPRERVAATHSLRVNAPKIVSNRAKRRRLSAESFQLWVTQVTVRATPEHSLSQEPFPPQSHKPASVEVLRMHGPETHLSTHSSWLPDDSWPKLPGFPEPWGGRDLWKISPRFPKRTRRPGQLEPFVRRTVCAPR